MQNFWWLMRIGLCAMPGFILALSAAFYFSDSPETYLLTNEGHSTHIPSDNLIDYTNSYPEKISEDIKLLAEGTQIKSKVFFKATPVARMSFDQNVEQSSKFEMAVPISFSEHSSKEYLLVIAYDQQAIPDISFKMNEDQLAPTELIIVKRIAEKSLIEQYNTEKLDYNFYFELIQSSVPQSLQGLIKYEKVNDTTVPVLLLLASIIYIFWLYRVSSNRFSKNKKLKLAGATLVEYGLLIALISLITIVTLRKTGGKVTCPFTVSGTSLQSFSPWTGPWVFKIPAEGRNFSQIISQDLAPCCNKAPNRSGFCQSATPSGGYFHCICR